MLAAYPTPDIPAIRRQLGPAFRWTRTPEGWCVDTPWTLPDGDVIAVWIVRTARGWVVTDYAETARWIRSVAPGDPAAAPRLGEQTRRPVTADPAVWAEAVRDLASAIATATRDWAARWRSPASDPDPPSSLSDRVRSGDTP